MDNSIHAISGCTAQHIPASCSSDISAHAQQYYMSFAITRPMFPISAQRYVGMNDAPKPGATQPRGQNELQATTRRVCDLQASTSRVYDLQAAAGRVSASPSCEHNSACYGSFDCNQLHRPHALVEGSSRNI
jgi:hypothetical protein